MRISDWSSDVCSSDLVGVVVAGVAIGLTGLLWIDPAISLVIVAVIVWGNWGLLRESVTLSLAAVPSGIDPGAVERLLASRSEEHTSELQSLMSLSYAVFCLKKKKV